MSSANFTPVHSEFVSILVGSLDLGNKGNTLSEVKVNILLAINSLDFDKTDTVVLVAKTALVAKDGTVNVKLWGSHLVYCVLKTEREKKQFGGEKRYCKSTNTAPESFSATFTVRIAYLQI
jgi:hypothetical protein